MRVRGQCHIGAMPQQVWAALTDVEGWQHWWPGLQGARCLTAGPLRLGSRVELLGHRGFRLKVAALEEPRRIVWSAWRLTFGLREVWGLEAAGQGTLVTLEEQVGGPLGLLVGRLMAGSYERVVADVLKGLKGYVEKGDAL